MPVTPLRAVADVLDRLRGHSSRAERRAAHALVALGPKALPELARAAAAQPNAFARATAITALAAHGARGHPAILRALKDPAMPVRLAALLALDAKWYSGAARQVIRLLGDPSGGIRGTAAAVLGRHRVRAARQALGGCLRDDKSYVRLAAVDALERIGGR